MWHLKTAESGQTWVTVGSFDTLTAAARRIIEFGGCPVSGIFFEVPVETEAGDEDEAFGHLEHTAKLSNCCYLVKRVRH